MRGIVVPKVNGLPWSVTILALLYIASGLWAIGSFFLGFFVREWGNDYGDFFWGLLKVSVGAGLLERSRAWRFALMAWLACSTAAKVTALLAGIIIYSSDATGWIAFQSQTIWEYPLASPMGLLFILTLVVIHLAWLGVQWWIVDRPEVRKLFIKSKNPGLAASTSSL